MFHARVRARCARFVASVIVASSCSFPRAGAAASAEEADPAPPPAEVAVAPPAETVSAPRAGVELTTGKTLRDVYAAVGVVQPKPFGAHADVGGVLVLEQRGYGARLFVAEDLSPKAWAFGAEVHFMTANLRFDSGESWYRSDLGGAIAWRAPRGEDAPFGFQVGVKYARELLVDVVGPLPPPDGHFAGGFVTGSFDASSDVGIVSRGVHASITLAPGVFFTTEGPQSRHAVESNVGGELPLSKSAMIVAHLVGNVSNRGNPNHSWLLGSVSGVRGLADNLYRNWWQVHGSIELVQRVALTPQWHVEGAAFGDGAGFEQLDVDGGRGQTRGAVSAGLGLRLRAKALDPIVLRLDGSRLFRAFDTEGDWFAQFGLGPYF